MYVVFLWNPRKRSVINNVGGEVSKEDMIYRLETGV